MRFNGKAITIVQASCDVHGLQQKYFLPLNGAPVLQRIFERIAAANVPGHIVVATTTEKYDDALCNFCLKRDIPVYRGAKDDLLDLYYKIANQYQADAVIKLQADCVLIDPQVISRIVNHYFDNHIDFDYISNLHPATYPSGYGVEVMSTESLQRVWCSAKRKITGEETTSYIWKNQHLFDVDNISCEHECIKASSYQWTLNFIDDYVFAQNLYNELFYGNPYFGLKDILMVLEQKPELTQSMSHNKSHYYRDDADNTLSAKIYQ